MSERSEMEPRHEREKNDHLFMRFWLLLSIPIILVIIGGGITFLFFFVLYMIAHWSDRYFIADQAIGAAAFAITWTFYFAGAYVVLRLLKITVELIRALGGVVEVWIHALGARKRNMVLNSTAGHVVTYDSEAPLGRRLHVDTTTSIANHYQRPLESGGNSGGMIAAPKRRVTSLFDLNEPVVEAEPEEAEDDMAYNNE